MPLGWPLGVLVCLAAAAKEPAGPRGPANLFANPSFEDGRDGWQMDLAGKTTARFTVDDKEAAAGRRSAVLSIDTVDEWGVQFGQTMDAPAAGQDLYLRRAGQEHQGPGQPCGWRSSAAASRRTGRPPAPPLTVTKDAWTELHVTFQVEKPFPEGWFAYVSCKQPTSEFRLDMFRLYEGQYVPYEKAAQEERGGRGGGLLRHRGRVRGSAAGRGLSQRTGWTKVPEDQTDHKFRGDAVWPTTAWRWCCAGAGRGRNSTARARKGWTAPGGARARRRRAGGAKLASVAIVENSAGEVALDAAFQSPGGKTLGLRFELAMGQAFVKTEPRDGATAAERRGPVPLRRAARLLRRRHRGRRRRDPGGRGRAAQRELPAAPAARPRGDRDDRGQQPGPGRADRAGRRRTPSG